MLRILIAEDEWVSAKLMLHLLGKLGGCTLASDGDEAIFHFLAAHARGEPFDVVFLDIGMPKKSGHEVLEAIRDYEAQNGIAPEDAVKVIITTVHNDAESEFAAHLCGCCYMLKPVTREKLVQALYTLGFKECHGE